MTSADPTLVVPERVKNPKEGHGPERITARDGAGLYCSPQGLQLTSEEPHEAYHTVSRMDARIPH